jgi:acyl-CoA thioesterase
MTEFDDAVALGGQPGAERTARLDEGWVVGSAVNGGILTALAVAAMQQAVEVAGGHGDPLVFSAYFLSAAQPGPARFHTEVLRTGRSMSSAAVAVTQGDGDAEVGRMRVLATFGDLDAQSAPVWRSARPPELPDPDSCMPASRGVAEFARKIHLLDRLDLRIDPSTAGWAIGRPSLEGRIRAWIRFADGREPDAASLPFFLDALMPVAFDLGALGWAPTIELTGHVRSRPAPGWLRVQLSTQNVIGGLLEEDAVIWDSTGAVVAQSRQLAGVRMPEEPREAR